MGAGDTNATVQHGPLLIVVSDSPHLPARIRSRQRDVRRWSADAAVMPPAADPAAAASASGGADGRAAAQRVPAFGGAPDAPETYAWTAGAHAVTALIDLAPPERARAALAALRQVRDDAAVLLLSDEVRDLDHAGDGTLARGGDIRDVLRLDIDDELRRLEAERRVFCLRRFAAGDEVVPILVHPDPDPDAVSSALAVRMLLGGDAARTPIVTVDPMTRRENRRMAELLNIRVTRVTPDELRRFERVITVDTQPRGLQRDGLPRVAVIDHHPPEPGTYHAEFLDIRPEYGATATMLTEYLRALDEKRIGRKLATALLHGIKTDTDSLTRGVTPADVAAYAFLQEQADLTLVRRFECPSYSPETARCFGQALAGMTCRDGVCVAWLGELDADESHILPDFADFCLGIENVTWVAAAATLEDNLVITLRHAGSDPGAGELARRLAASGGSGGGHATMARVTMPLADAEAALGLRPGPGITQSLERVVNEALGELDDSVSRPASLQAHQA
jgi:nanoRNase/pAp phosphatase (c-di-AMP/oligoRNAs hydrolase)